MTIRSVTLQNPLPGQQITEAQTVNCDAGLVLQAAAICYVAVDQFVE